ncbi:hypothetical protein ACFL0Z_01990 [Patescibacteria group bacterium]
MDNFDIQTLIIQEAFHLAIATVIALYIWKRYRKWWLVLLVFFFGFFIDIDHGMDYWLATGVNFNLDQFWNVDFYCWPGAFHILLHSPEFLIVLWLIKPLRKNGVALAITLAMLGHIGFDMMSNDVPWYTYSFFYRLYASFDLNILLGIPCGV